MNGFSRFLISAKLKMFILLIINIAIYVFCSLIGYWYIYFGASLLIALISTFVLANKKERDSFKVTVFMLILMLPFAGIGYGIIYRETKGNAKIKKVLMSSFIPPLKHRIDHRQSQHQSKLLQNCPQ